MKLSSKNIPIQIIRIDYCIRKKNVTKEISYIYVNNFCNFIQLQILHNDDYVREKYLTIGINNATIKHIIESINIGKKLS